MLDNKAPAVNADAQDHAGRMLPRRNDAARAANPIASSASAAAKPVSWRAGRPGDNTTNQRVKCAQIATAEWRNLRRHPRTVSGGMPKRSATLT